MGWSTRELAELAGTSLRAVRHYHEVGLLEEPERTQNRYKQYGPRHLVALLRIRRLVDLGFSLQQVAELHRDAAAGEDGLTEVLRGLDVQLAESIDRLQRARTELGMLLDGVVPGPDLPAGLSPLADQPWSAADRAYLVVVSRVVLPETLASYVAAAREAYTSPSARQFADLPPDATSRRRAELARRMRPEVQRMRERHPALDDLTAGSPLGAQRAARVLAEALEELYNDAQLDVMARIGAR